MAKTKIICTLGPASGSETVIRKMMLAGMDVARLNFSHGTFAGHKKSIDIVRRLNKKYRRHIRILADMEGFRIRIGRLTGHRPVLLNKGSVVRLTQEDVKGDKRIIPFDYKGDIKAVRKGQMIYIDDGTIALRAEKTEKKEIKARVVSGGEVRECKGINIPGARLDFPAMTEKDRLTLEFAARFRPDYIAQSFVRDKGDILRVRDIIKEKLPECGIIAKIENQSALKNIDSIIDVSWGIMIARGDLGVSVPVWEVPVIQKDIIKKCRKKKKTVITATQMLEHMTESPVPERAEASDIANAVIDGTDYVMLSAETAVGKYPAESVRMMNRIIEYTEKSL